MNHDINILTEFVCSWYGVTLDMLRSESRFKPLPQARLMICMLSTACDYTIAQAINRSREDVRYYRMKGKGYRDKQFLTDLERIKKELLTNEVSKY